MVFNLYRPQNGFQSLPVTVVHHLYRPQSGFQPLPAAEWFSISTGHSCNGFQPLPATVIFNLYRPQSGFQSLPAAEWFTISPPTERSSISTGHRMVHHLSTHRMISPIIYPSTSRKSDKDHPLPARTESWRLARKLIQRRRSVRVSLCRPETETSRTSISLPLQPRAPGARSPPWMPSTIAADGRVCVVALNKSRPDGLTLRSS